MIDLSTAMAKLSGIRQATSDALNEPITHLGGVQRPRSSFDPALVRHYFVQAASCLETLRTLLPDLYGDFQAIKTEPETAMVSEPGQPTLMHYSRRQAAQLIRDIDQVFEIRANSELAQPKQEPVQCVFITHGRSKDWLEVQPFIERDVNLRTLELAQEANLGRTIIEKLLDNAGRCDCAVIVMTGDDVANENENRVRENVMHEIGFFQGRYGRDRVILLHEEGVNIPTNLAGVAYIPFPSGNIGAGFHVLQREL